jgi:hypothetical protein
VTDAVTSGAIAAIALSSRRLATQHQGQIASEITSTASVALAPDAGLDGAGGAVGGAVCAIAAVHQTLSGLGKPAFPAELPMRPMHEDAPRVWSPFLVNAGRHSLILIDALRRVNRVCQFHRRPLSPHNAPGSPIPERYGMRALNRQSASGSAPSFSMSQG